MTVYVDFQPVGRRGTCPPGGTLLDCARELGVGLSNLCGGAGSCGRCVVQVLEGATSPVESVEAEFLTPEQLTAGYRLACRAVPLDRCKVRVPPESLSAPQRTQVEGESVPVVPEPLVQAHAVTLAPPSLDDLRADDQRLLAALAAQGVAVTGIDPAVLRHLSPRLREQRWQVSVAVRDGEVVGLLPPQARPLGLAVDLGTTKIATYLVDLATGQTLASRGLMNPQIAYGEDLIARLAFAGQGPAEAARMQEMVVEALNEAVAAMSTEVGAGPEAIVDAVVVGNTAMHHLLLRLPVHQLALAPYVPAVGSALDVKARDLGLGLAAGAGVHLLPNIAGYVGADHVAMLLATGLDQAEGVVLALDIGTNTEVCLANHGRLASLSCASGPAFEGAHIKHGMRAAEGAIEHLRLVGGRVEYETIGGAAPVGLCGSGILDTLAELVRARIVDRGGRMNDGPGVQGEGRSREFAVAGAIAFTQKDVRELQLAKGAMKTGIDVLLRTNGLVAGDIDRVIIAGAFGTYIDVASAITIGMLPALPLDRFRQVGNAAGMGARLALVSRTWRAAARALAERVRYVELASDPLFSKTFALAMYLD